MLQNKTAKKKKSVTENTKHTQLLVLAQLSGRRHSLYLRTNLQESLSSGEILSRAVKYIKFITQWVVVTLMSQHISSNACVHEQLEAINEVKKYAVEWNGHRF